MYAVIKTGGKQYKVAENEILEIEKIEAKAGDVVKFDQVLALGTEKGVELGAPTVKGATVSAEVIDQAKDDKVIIFKKQRRQNHRRKNGHRQEITIVRFIDVSGKGAAKKAAPKKAAPKATKKTATEAAPEKSTKKED